MPIGNQQLNFIMQSISLLHRAFFRQALSVQCALFMLALLTSGFSHAQNWYEIEVIIFEHIENESIAGENGVAQEAWPTDVKLSWPSPLLDLSAATSRNSAGLRPPFEALTRDERRLNNDAYAFRVKEPYRLLWHKAWQAPLLNEDNAPWIRVQADEEIGNHHRLEGAIRVHLSRYLHLSSNLWLTDIQSPNTATSPASDQENNTASYFDWSQLPAPVSTRWACNYFNEFWPNDQRFLPADYYEKPAPLTWYFPFGCQSVTSLQEQDIPHFVGTPLSSQNKDAELRKHYPELFQQKNQSGSNGNTSFNPLGSVPLANAETLSADETQYPISRIIHIEDSRRMRSGEVHYIDHPKIGILTTIHPVKKPLLSAEPE